MADGKKFHSEKELIDLVFAPLSTGFPGAFHLSDDAAIFSPTPGHDLVITNDALISGVHFFAADCPRDIAHKVLAVNLSDLAAKGARPIAYLLALAAPQALERDWYLAFAKGLEEAQCRASCHLIGGDTIISPGPLTLSITAFGEVPTGQMVKRSGACPGDLVYVSGTIGDSWLGLQIRHKAGLGREWALTPKNLAFLSHAYLRPEPKLELAPLLRAHASAAIDISDGLAGDFQTLCRASGMGGVLWGQKIPFSEAGKAALGCDPSLFEGMISGGDDYQILCTLPAEVAPDFEKKSYESGVQVQEIGQVKAADADIKFSGANGEPLSLKRLAYDHL